MSWLQWAGLMWRLLCGRFTPAIIERNALWMASRGDWWVHLHWLVDGLMEQYVCTRTQLPSTTDCLSLFQGRVRLEACEAVSDGLTTTNTTFFLCTMYKVVGGNVVLVLRTDISPSSNESSTTWAILARLRPNPSVGSQKP